jgi:hypothetical protein
LRELTLDEKRFLVTLLTQDGALWLNPVSGKTFTGERPEVELRKHGRPWPVPEGRKVARDLNEEDLVWWGPFGKDDEAVPIAFKEAGKAIAEALRDSGIEPFPEP